MTSSLERFSRWLKHEPIEKPLRWLGMPTPEAMPGLLNYFNAADVNELKAILDDDIYPVDVAYHHPPANHIACAFDWHVAHENESYTERSLTEAGFFARCNDIDRFSWPDPAEHIDVAECRENAERVPEGRIGLGILWSAHFQDVCAAFGMENALMQMLLEPEFFARVLERIVDFYLRANEIFYRATAGKIHAVLIGNDLGTQLNTIISPESFREFVVPGIRQLTSQAHAHGLKVIYHSCGAVSSIIPDLVAAGADVVHPIQARAAGMSAEELKAAYGTKYLYCGGVDVQDLMVRGTPDEVRREVRRLLEIFPENLILSPSHEALLPDVPPANVAALFDKC